MFFILILMLAVSERRIWAYRSCEEPCLPAQACRNRAS